MPEQLEVRPSGDGHPVAAAVRGSADLPHTRRHSRAFRGGMYGTFSRSTLSADAQRSVGAAFYPPRVSANS